MEAHKLLKPSKIFYLLVVGYLILISSLVSCSPRPERYALNDTPLVPNPTSTTNTLPVTSTDFELESSPTASILESSPISSALEPSPTVSALAPPRSNKTSFKPSLPTNDIPDDYSNVDDKEWCDSPEYEVTMANWNTNSVGKWYAEWASSLEADSYCKTADGKMMDEPACFARSKLGNQDFSCSISHNGCNSMPSCSEIAGKLKDKEQTRKVYLTLKQYQMYYEFWHAIDKSFDLAQVSLAHQLKEIATTFSWSYDKQAHQKCTDMAVKMKNSANNFVSQMFGWLPGIFGSLFRNVTRELAEDIGLIPSEARHLTTGQLSDRLCSNQILAPKNYGEFKEENLEVATHDLFKAIKASIFDIVEKSSSGSDTEGMLSMSETISQGVFILSMTEQRRITDNPSLQNDIEKIAKSSIIEENLKSENCHVTCHGQYYEFHCNMDIPGLCADGYHDCQVSCMRNEPRQATAVRMFGSDAVKDKGAWGFTEESLIRESVGQYIKNGWKNNGNSAANIIARIKRGDWSQGAFTPRLPMCHSVTGRPVKDYPNAVFFGPSNHWDLVDKPGRGAQDVNCVCQSRLAEHLEETKTFYEVTRLAQAPFWPAYTKLCANQHRLIGMNPEWPEKSIQEILRDIDKATNSTGTTISGDNLKDYLNSHEDDK